MHLERGHVPNYGPSRISVPSVISIHRGQFSEGHCCMQVRLDACRFAFRRRPLKNRFFG
jgi:hypothetical protein